MKLYSTSFNLLQLLVIQCLVTYSLPKFTLKPDKGPVTCSSPGKPIVKTDSQPYQNSSIVFLVLLESPTSIFDRVYDYIKINTRGCYQSTDVISIITPDCLNGDRGACQVSLETMMDSWTPDKFEPNGSMIDQMGAMLTQAFTIWLDNLVIGISSFTIITDMKCDDFCGSDLPSSFYTTISSFAVDSGYQIQLYFAKDADGDQCTNFFNATGLPHSFGILPFVNDNNVCYPPFSNEDTCVFTSDKIEFGIDTVRKDTSKLLIEGYFLQYWPMKDYENFVRQVTTDCGDNDKIESLGFKSVLDSGIEYSITQNEIDTLINETTSQYFMVSDPTQYDSAIITLSNSILKIKQNSSLDRNNYIYIFTDIDCNLLCSFTNNATPYFVNTMKECYSSGFMVNIFQMPKLTAHCDSFSNYWASMGLPDIVPLPVDTNIINKYLICGNADIIETTTIPENTKQTTIFTQTTKTTARLTSTITVEITSAAPSKDNDLKLSIIIGSSGLFLSIIILIVFCIIYRRRKRARNLNNLIGRTANTTKVHRNQISDKMWQLSVDHLIVKENELLGRGAFGCVYKGSFRGSIPSLKEHKLLQMPLVQGADGSYQAAVKRLPPHATEFQRQELFQEIEFMKNLGHHLHVVAMLGYIALPDDPMLLLEYCENGDLHKYLQKLRTTNCYLHANNFVHRDIASRNILPTENMTAKISDFGLCRHSDSAQYIAKGGKLPIRWMAIESLSFMEFSAKSDVWSFGVTVWEIFSVGESPFATIQGEDLAQYLKDGNRLHFPEECPTEIVSIIVCCWNEVSDERPTADELRDKLGTLLNDTSLHYGYLNFESDAADTSAKNTINEDG